MPSRLTPARRRGVEILDDPATPADIRERSMANVVRSNVLFGGTRAAVRALRGILPQLPNDTTLIDIGTGFADIPAAAKGIARNAGVTVAAFGLDVSEVVLRKALGVLNGAVLGDALRLPFRDGSFDVVTCSQLLHHFADDDARLLIRELHRVSRGWVIILDLRRSWIAAAAFWIASVLFWFDPVTRHDGTASVLRGFTAGELETLVRETTSVKPRVEHGPFWRLSATWTKSR